LKKRGVVFFLAGGCLLLSRLCALDFGLKAYGGWSLTPGGDLNRSIRGWRDYYASRSGASFSSSFAWKELSGVFEAGGELEVAISSRWRLGLGAGYLPGVTAGKISTRLSTRQTTVISATQSKIVSVDETTSRTPRAELRTVPVLLTVTYLLGRGHKLDMYAGVGGGVYFGRYSDTEQYQDNFNSTDDLVSAGSTVRFVDQSAASGVYSEEANHTAWGIHGLVGLAYWLSPSLSATVEVIGRWVERKGWTGTKTDSYNWSHTWGPAGGYSDSGKVSESSGGELWRVDAVSETTGKTYPRLVFSEKQPAGSGYASARPADLGLTGVGLRVGLRLGFGGRR
jgi:hypothetical protein